VAGGAAIQSSLIVGNGVSPSLADSCVVACGSRLGVSPQYGVHLGAIGSVQGVSVVTFQQGASLFGGEIAWQIMNQASARAKIFYSMYADVMQFLTTTSGNVAAGGSLVASLNTTGLIVGPPSTTPAESCIVASGAIPSVVNTTGVHLGQLASNGGTVVRLAGPNSTSGPAIIDFGQVGALGLGRGALIYNFVQTNDDIFQICSDSGAACLAVCQTGCVIGRGASIANGSVPESALIVTGARPDANPATAGVHSGLVSSTTASTVLAASAKTQNSQLDWTYAGQTTSPTLRLLANHTLGRAQFLMGNLTTGTGLTQAMSVSQGGLLIGPTVGTPESALLVQGNLVGGVLNANPTQAGVHAGMTSTQGNAGIILAAASFTYQSSIVFTYPGSPSPASINFDTPNVNMTFNAGGGDFVYLRNTKLMGVQVSLPLAPLHVAGNYSVAVLTKGILSGMDNTSNNNAKLCICAAATSALSILDFSYAGQQTTGTVGGANSNTCKGRISLSHTNGQMLFYCQQSTSPAIVIDGSTANQTILINTTTSLTTNPYRLYVTGNSYFAGNTTASGTKTFDIAHPTKPGFRLRHRCIESPQARLMYEYTVDAQEGLNSTPLPEWFSTMNSDCAVYCSPFRHFGQAWGDVVEGVLQVTANCRGTFRVLVLGTRSDQVAQAEWREFGVEYPDPQ
jgi:hypothetical protein